MKNQGHRRAIVNRKRQKKRGKMSKSQRIRRAKEKRDKERLQESLLEVPAADCTLAIKTEIPDSLENDTKFVLSDITIAPHIEESMHIFGIPEDNVYPTDQLVSSTFQDQSNATILPCSGPTVIKKEPLTDDIDESRNVQNFQLENCGRCVPVVKKGLHTIKHLDEFRNPQNFLLKNQNNFISNNIKKVQGTVVQSIPDSGTEPFNRICLPPDLSVIASSTLSQINETCTTGSINAVPRDGLFGNEKNTRPLGVLLSSSRPLVFKQSLNSPLRTYSNVSGNPSILERSVRDYSLSNKRQKSDDVTSSNTPTSNLTSVEKSTSDNLKVIVDSTNEAPEALTSCRSQTKDVKYETFYIAPGMRSFKKKPPVKNSRKRNFDECEEIIEDLSDPTTLVSKYLTDPDFNFLLGLMPLLKKMSLCDRLKARSRIQEIINEIGQASREKDS